MDGHKWEVGWMSQHLLPPPPTDKRQGGGLCTAVALALLLVEFPVAPIGTRLSDAADTAHAKEEGQKQREWFISIFS